MMPAKIVETIERDGKTINVYDNGMEKDASNGHIVTPPPHVLIKDTENSIALHRARKEKRQAIMVEAANEAVEDGKLREQYGDLAFVAEITKAAMKKAKRIADPKQIEAARFIMEGTGVGFAVDRDDGSPAQPGTPRFVLLLQQLHERQNVVDGELLSESDISESNTSEAVRIGEQDKDADAGSPTETDDAS